MAKKYKIKEWVEATDDTTPCEQCRDANGFDQCGSEKGHFSDCCARVGNFYPIVDKSKLVGRKNKSVCRRCGGSGWLSGMEHVEGGRCFSCN